MNTRPLVSVKGFLGKNNVSDPSRFLGRKGAFYLAECLNVDIDDQLMPHRRDGYPSAASYSGTAIHSLWAENDVCLFVQNGDLKSLSAAFSATTIKSGVGHARMNYVRPTSDIYLTNNSVIGYIRGEIYYDFTAPDQTFKSMMKPGHLIEWYNGRLYVARGGEVWFSDPVYPWSTDERKNFKQLGGYVSLMAAVKDGIYVSEGKATYFMAGMDPGEASLVRVADYPAIVGSFVKVDAEKIGRDLTGRAVIFSTTMGVCAGLDSGNFINLTQNFYRPELSGEGAAILRQNGNFFQYLVSQKS